MVISITDTYYLINTSKCNTLGSMCKAIVKYLQPFIPWTFYASTFKIDANLYSIFGRLAMYLFSNRIILLTY